MKKLLDPFREDKNSLTLARETAQVMLDIVQSQKYQTLKELVKTIKRAEKIIVEENPLQFGIQNVVRRILSVVSESSEEALTKNAKDNSKNDDSAQEEKEILKNGRTKLLESLQKILKEMDCLDATLANYANNHINPQEIILVYGFSETILQFLIAAREGREFEVIVLEEETHSTGSKMVTELTKSRIQAHLIPFSSAFAFMPHVNKIFIGAHSILKNGGLLGKNGTLLLSSAARAFKVPLFVLSSSIKLTPQVAQQQNTFNEVSNPSEILPNHFSLNENQTVISTKLDYVAPEYVHLYLTDRGENAPNTIDSLVTTIYNSEQ